MSMKEGFSLGSRDILFNNDGSGGGSGKSSSGRRGKDESTISRMKAAGRLLTESMMGRRPDVRGLNAALDELGIGGMHKPEQSSEGEQETTSSDGEGKASE